MRAGDPVRLAHAVISARRVSGVFLGMKRQFRLRDSLSLLPGMGPFKKPKTDTPAAVADAAPDDPPSASAAASTSSTPAASEILQHEPTDTSAAASTSSTSSVDPQTTLLPQTPRGKKWLSGTGSWRSKAPAIVKTATESIGVSVSGGASGELPSQDTKKSRDDSPKKFLTKRKSSKGDAIPAAITQVNVSSDGMVDDSPKTAPETTPQTDETPTPKVDEPPLPPDPPIPQGEAVANTWAWRSWWSRPDGYSDVDKAKSSKQESVEEASSTPLPGPTPSEEPDAATKGLHSASSTASTALGSSDSSDTQVQSTEPQVEATTEGGAKDVPDGSMEAAKRVASGRSWFWGWSKAQNAQGVPDATPELDKVVQEANQIPQVPPEAPAVEVGNTPVPPSEPNLVNTNVSTDASKKSVENPGPSKPSAWAFWYRDKQGSGKNVAEIGAQKHVGEVAVIDTPSQSHPEAAQFNEQQQPQQEAAKQDPTPSQSAKDEPTPKKSFASLRGRPKAKTASKEFVAVDKSNASTTSLPSKTTPAVEPTRPESAPPAKPAPKQVTKAKQEPENLLFPEFNSTYQFVQQPSFWKQVRRYFVGSEPASPHLHRNPAPPRIKKAVAVGVHGFFPAPIIQKVLGQPTGTSIRFANAAAAAIKDWSEARGYNPEIEQIALEGEGFIAERVNALWKLLLNWIDHIKAADFILVACHSQGVPVAMMLVAKLIQFGCVGTARIGVCAMAGVNMGPFIEYKTKYFGPTAAELFEFSNPKSLVSQMYLAALDEVLKYGVRILYVGSIDDQLVSLESSTFSTLSHPYIYRAVFVDGRIHAPDFLTYLVGFTLKLRNLGLSDHGLIRELSPALAGSLYGGEGHSSLYHEPAVYALAMQHALETTSLPIPPQQQRPSTSGSFQGISIPVIGEKVDPKDKDLFKLRVKEYEPNASSTNPNPFFLPWAMRGLLEEDFVKKELGKEVEDLLGMFEEWKPTGKQLKDVKFRLEAVRSKL